MNIRKRIIVALVGALIFTSAIGDPGKIKNVVAQGVDRESKVDSQVLDALQVAETSDFVIVMAEQADLSAAYTMTDWDERGWYVYNTLRETAARTQKSTIEQLERQGIRYRSFFAGNEIYVYGGTQQTLNAVLDLSAVGTVRAPVVVKLDPAQSTILQPFRLTLPQASIQALTAWGITDTGAPSFWSTFGRQGEGIIVANIDTGVQYTHPALAAAYRCAGGVSNSACWKDVISAGTAPYDDQGHGTHTMGTMVGSNNPNLSDNVGMAPKARWIACKAFNQAGNGGDPQINACADWLLAPDGNPSNRPHVINNSWGGDKSDVWFSSRVDAWYAAGIFPVFSAGNDGDTVTCGSIYSPADYQKGLAVAAHDQSRLNAYFSSRGPNILGDSPYTKPNISAPGVFIQSSIITGGFGLNNGTSMAAPHASGAVALLWSCNPALVGQIDQTFQLLQNSAGLPRAGACGAPGTGGNYTYGYGFLNVLQAGQGQCITWKKTYLPLISNGTAAPVPPDPIQNGGFEAGDVVWSEVSSNGWDLILTQSQLTHLAHTGDWQVWLGGDDLEVSALSQTITIPAGRSFLHYWIDSRSADLCNYDYYKIFVGGALIYTESICTSTATGAWVHRTLDLAAYAGTIQTIKFQVETDELEASSAYVDDISLQTSNTLSDFGLNEILEYSSGPEMFPDAVRIVKEE